ncbi:MAG: hypothetical protein QM752_06120 [Gammaproteobacteria bacterium]
MTQHLMPLSHAKNVQSHLSLLYALIHHLKIFLKRPIKVLNLTFPYLNLKSPTNHFEDVEVTCNPNLRPSHYLEFIQQALNSETYDIVVGINYELICNLLKHNPSDITHFLQFIADHSASAVYEFSTYKLYLYSPFFKQCYFNREIIAHSTPVIFMFCSNRYWYANGNLATFESGDLSRDTSANPKRHLTNTHYVFKYCQFAEPHIRIALKREIDFLINNNATGGFAPKLIHFSIGAYEGWLLRKHVPGTPFVRYLKDNLNYDPLNLIQNILVLLMSLEKNKQFYTNLRPENVLILPSGQATLLDYGEIEYKHKHFLKGYFSFILLSYEIFHHKIISHRRLNPAYLMNDALNPLYHQWVQLILAQPHYTWNFGRFYKLLQQAQQQQINAQAPIAANTFDAKHFQAWLNKLTHLIEKNRLHIKRFEYFIIDQLNLHYRKMPAFKRMLFFIKKYYLIGYDTLSLFLKSLILKKFKT